MYTSHSHAFVVVPYSTPPLILVPCRPMPLNILREHILLIVSLLHAHTSTPLHVVLLLLLRVLLLIRMLVGRAGKVEILRYQRWWGQRRRAATCVRASTRLGMCMCAERRSSGVLTGEWVVVVCSWVIALVVVLVDVPLSGVHVLVCKHLGCDTQCAENLSRYTAGIAWAYRCVYMYVYTSFYAEYDCDFAQEWKNRYSCETNRI